MKLTFETFESFLADASVEKIAALCEGDGAALLAYLKAEYGRPSPERRFEPDTIQACEAAASDADRSDRADEKVAELMEQVPKAWAMIKELVPKNSKFILRRDLERMEPW